MSVKASDPNPTVSRPDVAKKNRLTADDWEGNLSEKQVNDRFKALPKDTTQLFEELKKEYEGRIIRSVSDTLEWNDHLIQNLKKPDLVDLFTKWKFFQQERKRKYNLRNIGWKDFGMYLATANWKLRNEAYVRIFDLMWNSGGENSSVFLLPRLSHRVEGHHFAVAVDPRCLTPREPLHNSLEAYNIVEINLNNVLGLKYHKHGVTKDMIIAPVGQILSYYRHENAFPAKATEYALVLEIHENGEAGDFYIVNDIGDARLGDYTPFKVASLRGSRAFGFIGGFFSRDYFPIWWDSANPVWLDILSTLKPDIVMTGIRESENGTQIVGLYDQEFPQGQKAGLDGGAQT